MTRCNVCLMILRPPSSTRTDSLCPYSTLCRARHDVRGERRDLRNARQEYREDRRDWQRDRRYANWRAPFQYHRFVAGNRLNGRYYAPAYRLNYDARWRIPRAGAGLSYIRHYDDLLLVNVRSGAVVRVYRGFF